MAFNVRTLKKESEKKSRFHGKLALDLPVASLMAMGEGQRRSSPGLTWKGMTSFFFYDAEIDRHQDDDDHQAEDDR